MSLYRYYIIVITLFICSCKNEEPQRTSSDEEKSDVSIQSNLPLVELESVTIGDQIWMKNNLDVDQYTNGDPIPEIIDEEEWMNAAKGAWCYFNNDSQNGKIYGKLYNWQAVSDKRGLCPSGWRVPTEEDWDDLVDHLGDIETAGGHLKDTIGWKEENAGATNSTGFSAIPGGYRLANGTFLNQGIIATFWTLTKGEENNAWDRFIISKAGFLGRSQYGYENGFSCRCIKEQ